MHEIRSLVSAPTERKVVAQKGPKVAGGGSLATIAIQREEVRRSDQRREDRYPRISDRATLTYRRRRYEVELFNLSSHGAMIVTDLVPNIGEWVQIQFDGCNRTPCAVRWVRDGRVGLEFREETVVIASPAVRSHILGEPKKDQAPAVAERAPRHGLIWRGTLHSKFGSLDARLRNISAEGAMVECDQDLDENVEVVLDLGPGGTAPGAVRWCRSGQIGIRFTEKFEMRGLAAIRPSPERSPDLVKPRYLESEGQPDSPWYSSWDRLRPQDL